MVESGDAKLIETIYEASDSEFDELSSTEELGVGFLQVSMRTGVVTDAVMVTIVTVAVTTMVQDTVLDVILRDLVIIITDTTDMAIEAIKTVTMAMVTIE